MLRRQPRDGYGANPGDGYFVYFCPVLQDRGYDLQDLAAVTGPEDEHLAADQRQGDVKRRVPPGPVAGPRRSHGRRPLVNAES